jgi:hypothetical protein
MMVWDGHEECAAGWNMTGVTKRRMNDYGCVRNDKYLRRMARRL